MRHCQGTCSHPVVQLRRCPLGESTKRVALGWQQSAELASTTEKASASRGCWSACLARTQNGTNHRTQRLMNKAQKRDGPPFAGRPFACFEAHWPDSSSITRRTMSLRGGASRTVSKMSSAGGGGSSGPGKSGPAAATRSATAAPLTSAAAPSPHTVSVVASLSVFFPISTLQLRLPLGVACRRRVPGRRDRRSRCYHSIS